MNAVTGDEIRQTFLRFFEGKGHTVIPSASLVPQDDPTLLLTSAGMVQIKPYFLGLATPPNVRLASCQKCFRTSDVDSVGDSTHLTFFEMLGNFSVGDYFKKEAIEWAWEFVTQWLELPIDRLWITVFLDDDEAAGWWQETGVHPERILRLGEDDNFWGPAGESGPCGPCSEILYDFGEEYGCGRADCGPTCDCGRFSEIWNLVFTQYDQDREGKRTPLPKSNIDTGMGLERVAAVIQGKATLYETDLFAPLIEVVSQITGKEHGQDKTVDRAMRIAVEHGRAGTFLVADGVVPGNEGRGYVLRRVLRRAALFGKKLGLEDAFLARLADVVVETMGHVYPELKMNRELIRNVVALEEERFGQVLDIGLSWLDRMVERAEAEENKNISGRDVFMLYDTYGFPQELTTEIASERGFTVDLDGFEREMEQQRERARAAHKFSVGETTDLESYESLGVAPTDFVGYGQWRHGSVVAGLLVGGEAVGSAAESDEVEVVLRETPFYGEMGGQVGDTGWIRSEHGQVDVSQTTRPLPELVVHQGKVARGQISVGDHVEAEVDAERRLDIARNHTATHLLQAALRSVLGEHVRQSGSLVAPDRFRFDFTHLEAVDKEQLLRVQHMVNEKIRLNLPVAAQNTSYREAVGKGAIAIFGEKYGDTVRMVEVGDPPFSMELCGGTHVSWTGEIGLLHITSESSIGSGLRRIEAVTGRGAEQFLDQRLSTLDAVAEELESTPEAVQSKLSALLAEVEKERKRTVMLERELGRKEVESLTPVVEPVSGVKVISARVAATSPETLREMGDQLKQKHTSGAIVLGTEYRNKPIFMVTATADLVDRGFHSGEVVKYVGRIAGGGGGGKPDLGQGSGKDNKKLDQALSGGPKVISVHYDQDTGMWIWR